MSDRNRILFIENHEDTLESVTFILNRKGFEVFSARDVQSGISVGISNEFDILISDVGLPDGFGWQIVQELRKTKSFPAIALSVYSTETDIATQKGEGFDLCIPKPYHMNELVEVLKALSLENRIDLTKREKEH